MKGINDRSRPIILLCIADFEVAFSRDTANHPNSVKDFNDQTCQRAGVEEGALLPLKEVSYVVAFYSCKLGEHSGKTFLPIGTRLQYDVVSAMRNSLGRTA